MNLGTFRLLEAHEFDEDDSQGQQQFANVTLSHEQDAGRAFILQGIKEGKPQITLGGYGGTGKSTLTGVLAQDLVSLNIPTAYCAPTGRAASVLRRSLGANGISPAYCGTIHRMMYKPVMDATGAIVGFEMLEKLPWKQIVVDEASMVTKKMSEDLASYGIPILYIGDHGQLPPVGEDVGLMTNPDVRLETIRRQALDNPIIALSFLLRRGGDWRSFVKQTPELERVGLFDSMDYCVEKFEGFRDRPMSKDPVIVTRTNAQRTEFNNAVRIGLGTDKALVAGERVMCLKNAYMKDGGFIANGYTGRVNEILYSRNANHITANLVFPDEGVAVDRAVLALSQFGRSTTIKTIDDVSTGAQSMEEIGLLYDWAYARTCHKMQGSQAEHVIVKMERGNMTDDEWRRWSYTAVSRSTSKLTLIY